MQMRFYPEMWQAQMRNTHCEASDAFTPHVHKNTHKTPNGARKSRVISLSRWFHASHETAELHQINKKHVQSSKLTAVRARAPAANSLRTEARINPHRKHDRWSSASSTHLNTVQLINNSVPNLHLNNNIWYKDPDNNSEQQKTALKSHKYF